MDDSQIAENNDVIELDSQERLDSNYTDSEAVGNTTVRIAKEQFSVFELLRQVEREKLKISPAFQREDVWKNTDRAELIESILMGIPIPLIYLFEDENGIRQVVDGRQRITALKRFTDGNFKLSKLKVKTELNDKYFKDLEPFLQGKIEDYQLNTYVIQPPTPESIKFNIFDRVNRGGVQLNKQEMRHALYQGVATELLERLAKSQAFKQATGNGLKSNRMRDRYLILRFIGFYLYKHSLLGDYQYKSDIDDFLARVMVYLNKSAPPELIMELEKVFSLSMTNVYEILGRDAFRFSNSGTRRPINIGLFELLSYGFQDALIANVDKESLKGFINEEKEDIDIKNIFASGADSKNSVEFRFRLADQIRERLKNAN